ncbi:XrtA/PEP-CTERM system histidine kinase PrsK [Lichenicola sp.]|uniref:XrtA/PEP-CTERM system histidine kinase PrsK n=1 Tax=Lichenicola sp. TaxID=2804529 RepID=UPI003B003331
MMLFLATQISCAVLYLLLGAVILLQARGSRTALLLTAACLVTAAWAGSAALPGAGSAAPGSLLDLLHAAAWYGVALHLYRRNVADAVQGRFYLVVGLLVVAGIAAITVGEAPFRPVPGPAHAPGHAVTLLSIAILLRLLLAICQIVLLENLYRGTETDQRWHVGLFCIALAGTALYDVILITDAVLSHDLTPALVAGRAVAAMLVAPLLAVTAARNRRWNVNLHVSRTAAFHSATLMASGIFLVSLGSVAQLLTHTPWGLHSDWADLLEVALLFAGLIAVAVLLVSNSSRNWLARLVAQHFFTCRYDYRREWLRCLATLSQHERSDLEALPRAAIRALADIVDSPAGLLLSGAAGRDGLLWAASWNLAPIGPLPPEHPLLQTIESGACIELTDAMLQPPLAGLRLRFAVPLPGPGGEPEGCILLANPRGPFRLDAEVTALLGVLAQEVATRLAERDAVRALTETRDLRAYGERFAFVAHDIKNVAGQLRLLTANAEQHLADPEFQRDMLATVAASVRKITAMIRRLEVEEDAAGPEPQAALLPLLSAACCKARDASVQLGPAPPADWRVAMRDADLDAVLCHLLDNAAAAGPGGVVRIAAFRTGDRIVVEIRDRGCGMTPEFVRDELFRPFRSRTAGGSGIGAFQSRELLRRAGGDLLVLSVPGEGTTMRLLLPASEPAAVPARPMQPAPLASDLAMARI